MQDWTQILDTFSLNPRETLARFRWGNVDDVGDVNIYHVETRRM